MGNLFLFAYNRNSEGSKELTEALGIRRIRHEGSKFVPSATKTIINWGAGPNLFKGFDKCQVLNRPEHVVVASDKAATFRRFLDMGVNHPEWTTDRAVAIRWLEAGEMVFARTQLRASSGRGIVIMDPDHADTWEVNAPLYVKYIKKQHEYRVHVFRGRVIDVQRKALRDEFRGQQDVNWKIRNLANGFIFARNDGHVAPQAVRDLGIQAVGSLNLDFGAADIIWNERNQRAYCLEVNTAPGLQGQTVQSYAEAIRGM